MNIFDTMYDVEIHCEFGSWWATEHTLRVSVTGTDLSNVISTLEEAIKTEEEWRYGDTHAG